MSGARGRPDSVSSWFLRLLVVTATTQLVVFLLRPVLTYQALDIGASTAGLGVIVASFSMVSLVTAIPVGRAVDRHGERWFVLGGAVVLALGAVGITVSRSVATLVVTSAALGLGQLVTMIACQTLIANGRNRSRRDERFVTFTLVTSTSQFVGPALGGLLLGAGQAGSPSHDFGRVYVTVVVTAAVGCGAAAWLCFRPGALTERPHHFGRPTPGAMREVLRTPSVLIALIVGFSVLSAADLVVAFLPAYGRHVALSPRDVGFLIAALGLASIAIRVCLPALMRRFTRRTLLSTNLLLAAVGLAAVPWVTSLLLLYLLMAAIGAGLGVCGPIAISWVAGAVRPEIRGTAMSVRMAGNRLGQTVVPLAVGGAAGAAGIAVAFVGPAALLLVTGLLVLGARRLGAPDDRGLAVDD